MLSSANSVERLSNPLIDMISWRVSAGACYVNGGHDYLRRGFNEEGCFIELSEYEEVPEETIAGKER